MDENTFLIITPEKEQGKLFIAITLVSPIPLSLHTPAGLYSKLLLLSHRRWHPRRPIEPCIHRQKSLPLSPSLFICYSVTLTRSLTHSVILSLCHCHSVSHCRFLTVPLLLTLSLCVTLLLSNSLCHSLLMSLCHSFTLSHSLSVKRAVWLHSLLPQSMLASRGQTASLPLEHSATVSANHTTQSL